MHLNLESSRARVEQHTLSRSGAALPRPVTACIAVLPTEMRSSHNSSPLLFFYHPFLQVANFANVNEGQEGDDLSRTD